MSGNDFAKKQLENSLENILFNKEELTKLKKTIQKVSLGVIAPKELRIQIITNRTLIKEQLLSYLKFYIQAQLDDNSYSKTTNRADSLEIMKDLKEREDLLEVVGLKIKKIYRKLKKKVEI